MELALSASDEVLMMAHESKEDPDKLLEIVVR